ncbi:hypothetical protein DRQ21_09325 [Candidatus Fermentibacteria bacterium]|nr:MAG: hypothetical protein DRQ21_09325 [Candidatus Fermentibacteria bacterium]
MDAFALRDEIINQYKSYVTSFIKTRDPGIKQEVDRTVQQGLLWPDPLIQINPRFEQGESIAELVQQGILHSECEKIFAFKKNNQPPEPLKLYKHQSEAIHIAHGGENYVLTTGTGSGKSLSYIIPIVNHALRNPEKNRIKAIIVYPLNALANSQIEELKRFVDRGYPNEKGKVTFARYTGQESDEEKKAIRANPPDILLTNYVMLELILTRPEERLIIETAKGLSFLVLDELHTYRGRQGADVAMLVRRARSYFQAENMISIGTSATMAGDGDADERKEEVASVASKLFGAEVKPCNVIGETLTRITEYSNTASEKFVEKLKHRVETGKPVPLVYNEFVKDPLAIWVETQFGVEKNDQNVLERAVPKPIRGRKGVAVLLSKLLGTGVDKSEKLIQSTLDAGNEIQIPGSGGKPCFAYRLHQFISPSETVFTTLEEPDKRKVTLSGQYYSPSDPQKILLPMVFCRECGQEFYSVRYLPEENRIEPRDFYDRQQGDESEASGYIYLNTDNPWPEDKQQALRRLPVDWLEESDGKVYLPKNRRSWAPEVLKLNPAGLEDDRGLQVALFKAPFRFCPHCGVTYATQQRSDYSKLATLGTEGRSTATTILTLGAIAELKKDKDLDNEAKKLLSFTDNRQDAALQAGHFNDFIQMGILRAGIYRAVKNAGDAGLEHDVLKEAVADAMNIPFQEYSSEPERIFVARQDVEKAFRNVLAYRVYSDLKRGWRITVPNLEQCGLLRIEYKFLSEICSAPDIWKDAHPALSGASVETRVRIEKTLLDYMRRELAVQVEYLDAGAQDKLKHNSSQYLVDPWALDEDEKLNYATILFPFSRPKNNKLFSKGKKYRFMSGRGGMGRFLRSSSTLPGYTEKLTLAETDQIIVDLLEALRVGGLVAKVLSHGRNPISGYQLKASAMIWKPGDGTAPLHDPIRVIRESKADSKTNSYFRRYYQDVAGRILQINAKEHTAQVRSAVREEREEEFRTGKLPVLYCSPTMELGVDIAQLNVVNMRNVPPNPANYAQRSGRAGRSGQPALVFTYCGRRRPHDQYFFRRPEKMVAGSVVPPRIDLANEELIRSHLHAIWLSETGVKLGRSLRDLLMLPRDGKPEIIQEIRARLADNNARKRAEERAEHVFEDVIPSLKNTFWYKTSWITEELNRVMDRFEDSLERWRYLYLSAMSQMKQQHAIRQDSSRDKKDRDRAKRLYDEAERQRELLLNENTDMGSDFYSYRYFASEGFLPGYNFPRLPLTAFIPGRRNKSSEYLSRSRFLAISEFGPRSLIYHEGAKYEIDKVIFQVVGSEPRTSEVKICEECGYLHTISEPPGPDLCENCKAQLPVAMHNMFRLQNVSTRRRERISADEEERVRFGFELKTAVRFAETTSGLSNRQSEVTDENGHTLMKLTYGPSATLWRINLGWNRRKDRNVLGFVLDVEKGRWEKAETLEENSSDPSKAITRRVIPYVEDTKNCMIMEPQVPLERGQFFSLMAALKNGIQISYQIEDRELAAEPMPNKMNPTGILLYESSEGGAGVLNRIFEDTNSLNRIAEEALKLCHFNPETLENTADPEECSKACYECLMSYYNQSEHSVLDRHGIKDILSSLKNGTHSISPVPDNREDHYAKLINLCDSTLEKQWLEMLKKHNLHLPDKSQVLIEQCSTRVDFMYAKDYLVIYIDGPVHDEPKTRADDRVKREALENMGYTVISFRYDEKKNWLNQCLQIKSVFGGSKTVGIMKE